MIGQTISHYKILEKLGEGGMGVVYKAQDLKLDRLVALKFLPQQIAVSAEDEARFLQEAKAISGLNHPYIATIFDADEVEGQKFLVLEYIPGGTLKSKLKHLKSDDREFSLAEVLDYGIQAAEALAHAHRRQIIHRDVKTDNLMLTDEGKLKLTDFGLAKLRGSAQVTKKGTTVGTAAYMSPEQIRGEEVDLRSDIFSLGVVLYELLTSRLPFRGEFETALNYSILNEDPPSVMSLRKEAPPALEKIIHRCLTKEKAKRYQSAEEVADALREIQQQTSRATTIRKKGLRIPLLVGGALVVVAGLVIAFFWPQKPTPSVQKSIAVLPFDDMSPQKNQEWFCDGMTETLIDRLSNVKGLKVPARTSAFAFKGKLQDIREIGRQLNVQTVLEGSIQEAGDRLRVTVQLINIADGYHIWSQKYDRELKDVFATQDEISFAIVKALTLKLAPEEKVQITRRAVDNVQAYELHLRARYEMYHGTKEGLERALQLVRGGLEIIGDNETLYGDMGAVYLLYEDAGIEKGEAILGKAEECITKVFAQNPESAGGHYLRGWLHRRRGNAQEAVREFKQSLALDPSNPELIGWLAWVYSHSGKGSAAEPMVSKLVEIDPLSPFTYLWEGAAEVVEGRFEISVETFGKGHQMDRESPLFLYWQAKALAYAGHNEEAIKLFDLLGKESPQTIFAMLGSFFKSALQNKKAEALQSATEDLKSLARRDEMFPIWMAESYALINEKNEAIDWLEQGINWGFINYLFLVEYDRFLANLRGEDRFMKLMERVKKEWEEFEV